MAQADGRLAAWGGPSGGAAEPPSGFGYQLVGPSYDAHARYQNPEGVKVGPAPAPAPAPAENRAAANVMVLQEENEKEHEHELEKEHEKKHTHEQERRQSGGSVPTTRHSDAPTAAAPAENESAAAAAVATAASPSRPISRRPVLGALALVAVGVGALRGTRRVYARRARAQQQEEKYARTTRAAHRRGARGGTEARGGPHTHTHPRALPYRAPFHR